VSHDRSLPYAAPSSAEFRYRGIKQDLPDGFLRPPGYQSTIITDEELSLMLQNELFQKEVRTILGDEFMTPSGAHRSSRGAAVDGTASGTTAGASNADLGIMKALSSMGSATKKNLTLLAQRFSAGGATSAGAARRSSRGEETGTAREFRPLVESNHLDDVRRTCSIYKLYHLSNTCVCVGGR
jgi:hypothetical protein